MPLGTTTYRVEDGVAVIELVNLPLNLVSLPLTADLNEHLKAAADDHQVHAIVLTGAGEKAFCAGSDIDEFDEFMQSGRVVPGKLRFQNEVFSRLEQLPKPTVAALNGLAYGGGLEIALCCDVIVADETAKLALPEIRLGVFPSSGGPVRLSRRIGPGRAKRMIFTAESVDARQAEQMGLVDELVPQGTALVAALRLATEMGRGPALGLAAAKDLIDRSHVDDWVTLREVSFQWSDEAFSSFDCTEGVRAFRAKEEPNFRQAIQGSATASAEGAR
ncbi:enoyl-CoA hydratase/isomerase family protein [Arthrobacter sp. SDTb3-6]|uniref:enoyl-CoA hydratase/isomerase family protein n=1 Tax=Arthrobacter sp. SDTb3-6 TaxID=2713571 RepID=UPI00159D8C4B|nr:enoyl-CoA hydratase/isomerase family protein [Arthrobacter sp. SDTb3-6]NVM98484.1 enoyl-CoA hydratase/isomerase family protein [Arthrobacter sp. SDTb3-6]